MPDPRKDSRNILAFAPAVRPCLICDLSSTSDWIVKQEQPAFASIIKELSEMYTSSIVALLKSWVKCILLVL